jgi:hypothetical protein
MKDIWFQSSKSDIRTGNTDLGIIRVVLEAMNVV